MTRARHDAPALGVPVVDDLARMRAKHIAAAKTPDEIRSAIRSAAQFCPRCGRLLRAHDDAALNECARHLGDVS
jgi:hypothetical protein